jgi:GTP-binding protein
VLESYVDEDGVGFPFTVQLFSALKRIGIEEADAKILALAGLDGVAGEYEGEEEQEHDEHGAPSADDDQTSA